MPLSRVQIVGLLASAMACGSIVAGSVSMTGNAGGTVDGSVIGMTDNPLTLNGHSSITISSTGTTNYPSGMSFGNSYTPLPGTYIEVTPW